MNNEIKEIKFSNLEWIKTHDNMGGVMGNVIFKDNISYEEYNKLSKSAYFKSVYFILCDKDYITNLQEENEDLKDRLKVMEHFKNSLQEENEKLKELCDKYEEEHSNEFKIWKNERHQILDYKSRCERAIEYIKDFENKFKGYAVFPDKRFLDLEELLSILNGGNE